LRSQYCRLQYCGISADEESQMERRNREIEVILRGMKIARESSVAIIVD
jgi:hypothetical protein